MSNCVNFCKPPPPEMRFALSAAICQGTRTKFENTARQNDLAMDHATDRILAASGIGEAQMNEEAHRLLRQIRTCCVMLTSLATFVFAWWFVPIVWNTLTSAPLVLVTILSIAAIVTFTATLIFAIQRNARPQIPPPAK